MVELVHAKHFIRQYLKLYLDPPSRYTDEDQDQDLNLDQAKKYNHSM